MNGKVDRCRAVYHTQLGILFAPGCWQRSQAGLCEAGYVIRSGLRKCCSHKTDSLDIHTAVGGLFSEVGGCVYYGCCHQSPPPAVFRYSQKLAAAAVTGGSVFRLENNRARPAASNCLYAGLCVPHTCLASHATN